MAVATRRKTAAAAAGTTTKETASSTPTSSRSFLDRPVPGLTIGTAIVGWLVLTTAVPLLFLSGDRRWNTINGLGLSILFFNNLNLLVAFCEIALGRHIAFIKHHYQVLRERYGGLAISNNERLAAFAYLTAPLSLTSLFDGQEWAVMWSTYSLWDPSYQNDESFGFFIDVGNGWSTIVPCLLWNVAICCPHHFDAHSNSNSSFALWVGFIGAMSYWQVLYGTIIYLLSYVWNRRYVGRPWQEVLGFVGCANGIWLVFPVLALYASFQILETRDVRAVFSVAATATASS